MTTLVFLLEEPSARALLEGLLPRILAPEIEIQYMVFEGKQDLEKRMVMRLRGWLRHDSRFVVMRDQDANPDCRSIKDKLRGLAAEAGRPDALIRIACRELESWALAAQQGKAACREPDRLANPADELRKHVPEYQKMDGARRLGPLLDPERNTSRSFVNFCRGVRGLVDAARVAD